MKLAIVGSRAWPERDTVEQYVSGLPIETEIISGGARGVDTWAADMARARGMRVTIFPVRTDDLPDDSRKRRFEFARRAFERNRQIVKEAEYVAAFWDTKSKGTQHAVKCARELQRPVLVILPRGVDPRHHKI